MPRKTDWNEKVNLLRTYCREEKRMPTYTEMMALFGYRSKNAVSRAMQHFKNMGVVQQNAAGKWIPHGSLMGQIPLLGLVQAGFPSPAEEELVDTISLDEFLVEHPASTFMLRVSGDSMLDAGIHPGDLVLIEKGRRPKKNEIVVAQVDGEWTLKYYSWDEEGIFLDPANAHYQRIRPRHTLEIGGVVKAVVRKYQ